jgi:hypothetical protein
VLRYVTTGALPPSSAKGRNFLMDPCLFNKTEVIGDAKLKFRGFSEKPVIAQRRAYLPLKKLKLESVGNSLKTKDEDGQVI